MNGVSRHMACVLCRDRKVRCNGEQPTCEKCRLAGERCVYLPTYKPNKADLAQRVETLQERLDKAEAHIRKMESEANTRALSYFSPASMAVDYTASTPMSIHMPPFPSPSDSGFNTGQMNLPQWLHEAQSKQQAADTLVSDLFSSPIVNTLRVTNGNGDGRLLQLEDSDMPDSARQNISIPSLREIRKLNSISTHAPSMSDGAGSQSDLGKVLANELADFSVAVFCTQVDIAGISLALAEYLEWMRKVSKTTDTSMLETLEFRAREIHEMAETRHWVAWKSMMAALKPLGRLEPRLSELEEDICRRTTDADKFFHTDYDVRMTLDDQRKVRMTRAREYTPARGSETSEGQMET